MISQGVKIANLEKRGDQYFYRNRFWTLNKPVPSTSKGKKLMVLSPKIVNGEKRVKIIHFGVCGVKKHHSQQEKECHLKRSAKIRNQNGKLTMHDQWSPNYWSRKVLWANGQSAAAPQARRQVA